MCVNAIRTILQLTLVTHGHLLRVRLGATKGTNIPIITHNILIIVVLLCRCGPYMCRYVFPRTIGRVPYLSSNQKLLHMQEYTHVLMQLRTGSPPYVPYDAPVPQACKQVLNVCPIETMNIIVLLLPLGQRLSTDKWPCHMEAPLVCTIHGANLIIHIMSLHPFGPLAIPNENICRCPRGQRTNPTDVAQAVNGNRNFVYAPGVVRIKQDIAKDASYGCVDCESLTPTRGATQQSVDCESLTPTRGATQQSVDCESLTPTRGATQQSVESKIVRFPQ